MPIEMWTPVNGFEDRYAVSSMGRVKSISFPQRYLLRNGKEAYRLTRERILATQEINSGYLIVHLHCDNVRHAKLVHRLVAAHFVTGLREGLDVNHINGNKQDNRAENLEWVTRTDNHKHAVKLRLNKQAIPVVDPTTGARYDSIAQAAAGVRVAARKVSATFLRVA